MHLLLPVASITPVIYELTEVPAGTPTPANAIGVWVTLFGRGGLGTAGGHVANSNQNTTGGRGGGGGGRIGRSFIPIAALGPTFSLTAGSTGSRAAVFSCGSVVWQANWGADGGGGGVASVTGYSTGVQLGNGGDGGAGGSASGAGGPGGAGGNSTNGAGGGGGGGGGSRSQNGVTHGAGGAGGISSGGDPPGVGNGGKGSAGTSSGGNSADGGRGNSGGGYTASGGSAVPGIAYTLLEWV